MKVQVRQKVFETNSSSTHSFAMASWNAKWEELPGIQSGVLEIGCGWFDLEKKTFNDPITKASYLLTYIASFYTPRLRPSFRQDVQPSQVLENIMADSRFHKLAAAFERYAGATVVPSMEDPSWPDEPWGHIDHQSVESGVPAMILELPNDLFHAWLFNRENTLHTDSDEC